MATLSGSPLIASGRGVAAPQARESCATTLLSNMRAEAIRLLRPGFLGVGLLVEAAVVVLFTVGIFLAVSDQPGPYAVFRTELEAPDGIVAAVKHANNFLAIVVITWVAMAVAGDYTSGLVRLLVQAEPRRWRLLVGKFVVLAALTVLAAAVAVAVSLVASPLMAATQDVSTARWGADSLGPILKTFLNLSLGLLVWAAIEFAIAVLTRSVSIAIAGAIAYGLVVEDVVVMIHKGLQGWLPGRTIQALIVEGNDVMGYHRALGLALAYALVAVVLSVVVFQRRDITS
jgi:ABC-2 type transport system permease protein